MSDQQRDAAAKICRASGIIERAGKVRVLEHEQPNWQGNNPALLKLTSGTTAAPRAIRFGSEQLLADCEQICDTMGVSDVDLNFGVIPISHSYGFSNLLTPLIARGVPLVVSQDRTPRAVLADIAKTDATVFPGMPLFYQAFCEMKNIPPLPKLRVCISAGAPLPIATAKKFRDKFALPIHSFYGASECGGICYDREAKNEIEGFVGSPMKDVDLEMIEPGAETSQVRVRSAAVGDGYFPDVDEEKLGNGVFVPDDLLARHGSGFKIVGRISDVINVAGISRRSSGGCLWSSRRRGIAKRGGRGLRRCEYRSSRKRADGILSNSVERVAGAKADFYRRFDSDQRTRENQPAGIGGAIQVATSRCGVRGGRSAAKNSLHLRRSRHC